MYDENTPPAYLPPPARASGMGCFAKGCLTLLLVGVLLTVMFGAVGWYVARNLMPFASQQPATIRVFPATDAQYEAVREKIAPFVTAVNAGHAATLTLTADDLNILIARDSTASSLRGKAFFAIAHNQLAADVSYAINNKPANPSAVYLNGHVVFDASFANGDFTVVLRRVEPLGGGPTPGIIAWIVGNDNFSRNFSTSFNEGFHESIDKNPAAANFVARLQTVIVKDNAIVFTSAESSAPVAAPANPP